MISTLIFDLDGLLADTEKLHRRAYQDVLGELGVTVTEQQYEEHWIRNGRGITEFFEEHGIPVDPDIVRRRKAVRYRELVLSSAEAMPGALRALEDLQPHKTMALATSSYHDAAYAVIETLGIRKYFTCIATRDDVARLKPFPDIFLLVASRLNAIPAHCLVLEDAQKGIIAADAAGMRSIAIPNIHTSRNDFSKATMVLPSLGAVTVAKLDELDRLHGYDHIRDGQSIGLKG